MCAWRTSNPVRESVEARNAFSRLKEGSEPIEPRARVPRRIRPNAIDSRGRRTTRYPIRHQDPNPDVAALGSGRGTNGQNAARPSKASNAGIRVSPAQRMVTMATARTQPSEL